MVDKTFVINKEPFPTVRADSVSLVSHHFSGMKLTNTHAEDAKIALPFRMPATTMLANTTGRTTKYVHWSIEKDETANCAQETGDQIESLKKMYSILPRQTAAYSLELLF